jgi:hypothetical protein
MTRKLVFVLPAMLILAVTAYAHHSIGATYDQTKEIKVEGKLVQFLYRNPHAFVHIEGPDPSGKLQRWSIEWGGASQLAGQGVSRDTLKIGDEVVITGNPGRNPSDHRMKMNTLYRKSDGFGWGTRPGQVVE